MSDNQLMLALQEAHKETARWKAIAGMQVALVKQQYNFDMSTEVLPVSDDCVCRDSMVFWKSENGPEYVKASEHWGNIQHYPQFYSINEPRYTVTYLD
jgi:hypothetical protein